MKLWADWLADNPRDHARCPGLTRFVELILLRESAKQELLNEGRIEDTA